MEFVNSRELYEKGKIGDTTLIEGRVWIKTGEGIGDILMKPEEGDTERRVLSALSKITGESRETLVENDNDLACPVGTVLSSWTEPNGKIMAHISLTPPKRKAYIVWNEARNEGFLTTEAQLAYEVRKSSEGNCFDESGRQSTVGQAFCEAWGDDNCTIQEIEVPDPQVVFIEGQPVEKEKEMVWESRYLNRWKAENELCNHPAYHKDETASFCLKTKGHKGPHHPGVDDAD